MPFAHTLHHSDIMRDSHQVRWLHTRQPFDLNATLQSVATADGFRVRKIEPTPDTIEISLPSTRGNDPDIASGEPKASYRVFTATQSNSIATVHDFGNTDAPVAASQVRQILGSAPGHTIAIKVPQNIGTGNIFAYALSRHLNRIMDKVVASGVDSKSRSEALPHEESEFEQELENHRDQNAHQQQRAERFNNIDGRLLELNNGMNIVLGALEAVRSDHRLILEGGQAIRNEGQTLFGAMERLQLAHNNANEGNVDRGNVRIPPGDAGRRLYGRLLLGDGNS